MAPVEMRRHYLGQRGENGQSEIVRERRESEGEHKREKNVSKKKQHTSLEEPETGP